VPIPGGKKGAYGQTCSYAKSGHRPSVGGGGTEEHFLGEKKTADKLRKKGGGSMKKELSRASKKGDEGPRWWPLGGIALNKFRGRWWVQKTVGLSTKNSSLGLTD